MSHSPPLNSSSTCPLCGSSGKHDLSGRDLMFDGNRRFNYDRCTDCGLIYLTPAPTSEEIAGFYPDSYSIYTEPKQPHFSRRALRTLKYRMGYHHLAIENDGRLLDHVRPYKPVPNVIPYVPEGRTLDIGTGNGENLLRLKSIGWQCQGVEFNAKAVEICRKNGLDVFHGDLASAAYESNSFDFVTAHHLLEHVPDPHSLLAEIARITKPGGRVLIRTPNSSSLGRSLFGEYWFANDIPRHIMLYNRDNLNRLATGHGLLMESVNIPAKPKILLRSLDYKINNTGTPSEKNTLLKGLAKLYIPLALLTSRGDELAALYRKS